MDGAYREDMEHPESGAEPITPAVSVPWEKATVITFAAKPDRVRKLWQTSIELFPPKRLRRDEGGSIGLVKVGKGSVHAMVEFIKGFAPHDVLAGYYIAKKAGAHVTDLSGHPLDTNPMGPRQEFVAAADEKLSLDVVTMVNGVNPSAARIPQ
jgi:fructose-1,6-bisphosphatase/inositol monophosphatase family enzyme